MSDFTAVLERARAGEARAAEELIPMVYDQLRQLAAARLAREAPGHTLQPTALVHEAYLRLVDISDIDWKDRHHFFAVAANVMRNVLVDHARAHFAEKRGGHAPHISLEDAFELSNRNEADLLSIDEALSELAKFDERQSKIVELRFFGGLTIEETASVMGISVATVKREWILARTWLYRELKQ